MRVQRFERNRLLIAAVCLLLGAFDAVIISAPIDWEPGGAGTPPGGTGAWDLISNHWSPDGGVTFQPWPNTNLDAIARFGGTGGVVTVNAGIATNGFTFEADGYTLNGAAAITLNNNSLGFGPMITAAYSGQTATINAPLAGTNGATFLGTGSIVLGGANTLTGSFTISGTNITLLSATGSFDPSNSLTFNSGALTYDNTGATSASTQTFSGVYGFTGHATIQTNYVASQNVSLSFSSEGRSAGSTLNFIVNGGVNGVQNQISVGGTNQFTDQGTFFDGSSYAWSDAGGFLRAINYSGDPGAVTKGAATSVTGTYVQTTGAISAQATATFVTLNISGANNFSLASGATLTTNGILKSGGNAATFSGGTALKSANGQDLVIRTDLASDALTISTVISGSNPLTKTGAGTLTLSGTNSYSGETYIDEGALSIGAITNLSTKGPLGDPTNATNGAIQLNGGTLEYTGATASTNRAFDIGSGGGGINVTQAGTTLTISGANVGANTGLLADAFIKTGPGTLVLSGSGDDSGFTAAVDAGTLQLAKTSAEFTHAVGGQLGLVINSGGTAQLAGTNGDQIYDDADVIVNTGGVFDANGKSEAFDGLSGGGVLMNNSSSANSTLTIGANNSSYGDGRESFSGSFSNGSNGKTIILIKEGTGTETFTGASTFSGGVSITGGVLLVNNSSGSGTGAGKVTVENGAELGGHGSISGTVEIQSGGILSPSASDNGPGSFTLSGGLTLDSGSAVTLELGSNQDSIAITGGVFSDTGPLTLNLTGLSDFSPTTSYTLFNWTGASSSITVSDFALGSTPNGAGGSLSMVGETLVFVAVPEASASWLVLLACASFGASGRLSRRAEKA